MDEDAPAVGIGRKIEPPPEAFHGVRGNGEAGFDLDGYQPVSEIDEDIDLVTRSVSPEE